MWIDLVGARVLVCDLGGAWMNKALIVVWRGRGRRSDRRDRGFEARSLSFSLCLHVYESFFLSLFLFLRIFGNGLK